MIQKEFAYKIVKIIEYDMNVAGLAVGGSWITNEIDEFSDLDLILVTFDKISENNHQMFKYAGSFGQLLSAFTGDHLGEPRVLICLYDNPLLHVDIKFLTFDEFHSRVENPVILWEKDRGLSDIIKSTAAIWPKPDYQWIEDRFWVWIHYTSLKLGRGEYFEALDCLSFLRIIVLSPLMQIKNGYLPRGLRKVEMQLSITDLENLKLTVANYNPASIFESLRNSIKIYKSLRQQLFSPDIKLNTDTEIKSLDYLEQIEARQKINESASKRSPQYHSHESGNP